MAAAKLVLLLSLFVALAFSAGVFADGVSDGEDATVEVSVGSEAFDSSGFKIQVDQLNSKIRSLELQVDEKTRELNSKEEIIAGKEKIVQEKLDLIASLQSEVSSLQTKGSSVAAEEVEKAQAHARELEKQIERLKKEIESKNKERVSMEATTGKTEKKLSELNSRVEEFQKVNGDQKNKIQNLERALKMSEEEVLRLKHEATSKATELLEVHGAWLPPWLAVRWISFVTVTEAHWNSHGKPAVDMAIQKVIETKARAGKWAEPHVETIKTIYVPALKEQWVTVTTYFEPHVQSLSSKVKEAYDASKTAAAPHIVRVQEFVDPYYQEARKFSKPYIEQVAVMTKPHVDNMRIVIKPYTQKLILAYAKFLESATTYHQKVQDAVKDTLTKFELQSPATKELEWFAASALLMLPVIVLIKVFSRIFCKKAKKPERHSHPHHHARRKAKRNHSEK